MHFSAAGAILEIDRERELPPGQVYGHPVGPNTAMDHPIGDYQEPGQSSAQPREYHRPNSVH